MRVIPSQNGRPTSRYSPNRMAAKAMLYTGSSMGCRQEWYQDRQEEDAPDEFVQQHGGAVLARYASHVDVKKGEQRIQCGRQQPERDTQPVSYVQAEDQKHARDGDEADQDLHPGYPLPVDERVQQCREKAGSGDASDADGDVGRLDAGVERHPMQGQDAAAAGNQAEGLPGKPVQPAGEGQDKPQGRHAHHHPVPHERQPSERDQSPEDARPSGQEHGCVEQDQGLCFLVHRCKLSIFPLPAKRRCTQKNTAACFPASGGRNSNLKLNL